MTETEIPASDIKILQKLARRKIEIAHHPLNLERKELWYRHDRGAPCRPLVLAEHGGIRDARGPLSSMVLECTDPWARGVEWGLRSDFYLFDTLQDDHVMEANLQINWQLAVSGYGVSSVMHSADNYAGMGARRWDPPIKDLDADFGKLRPRTYAVDREATLAEKARLEAVFGDILPVRIRGSFWWTFGLTIVAIDLIGLENLMLAMYDNPAGLHRLMTFLHDEHLACARWAEREGLLTLNNENDYLGSGSIGYTRDLPRPGLAPGAPARMRDLWLLLESQETVGVGPELFEEFIFPHHSSLAKQFGKVYYGCCEPVHSRWHVLKRIPNLARVSVSPWADEAFMARELGRAIVYSRKPNPTLISTDRFDEAAIRADLRRTLTVARDCRVELIMKDVHTLNNEPERLPRWVQLARETIAETGRMHD
jgi:hypothetical protein